MSNATLQVGGGNWAAQDGKLLGYAVESTSGRYLAREFTVNRDSSKWVLGSDGYLYEVPADQPALEYYSDGTFRGALVEPQSVNEAINSENFNNWSKISGALISSNAETSPSNTLTADRLYGAVDDTSIDLRQSFTFTGVVNNYVGVKFFFLTETFSSNANITASYRLYPNGWYRLSATLDNKYTLSVFAKNNGANEITLNFAVPDNVYRFIITNSSGDINQGVYLWGAQLEESPIATSYIPTTTGAVTRLKDDISFTNASSVIGQSEGTLFVEVDWQLTSGTTQILLGATDANFANGFRIYNNSSPVNLTMRARADSVDLTFQGEASTSYTGIQKIAFAYAENDFELYRNGSSISSDTSGSFSALATVANVDIGQGTGLGGEANMWIRDARIYNTRLTDTECQDLTNVESFNTEYLIVAGGGGGGNSQISNFPRAGGGGGAGGVLQGNISLTSSELFTVTVGDGGNGSTGDAAAGQSGENSVFASLTAIGGGGGGGSNADNAKNGGSGGGGGESQPAGTGTVGQGNNGGSGASDGGGGGGGAGSVGANGTEDNGGNGGSGIESTITGASVYYAGGGGGGGTSSGGNGGIGGGGNGGANANGSNATANTGGGGGGTGDATSSHYNGGNGGSGIVVIKYPSSLSVKYGTGLTFNTQTSGGYKITTFTSGTGQIAIQ